MPSKILFVFHDSGRTGATIALWRYVHWLRENTGHEMIFLFRSAGVMSEEAAKAGKVFFWNTAGRKKGILERIADKINPPGSHRDRTLDELKKEMPGLIYANTLVSGELIPVLKSKLGVPVILHVHELQKMAAQLHLRLEEFMPVVNHFIANSGSTARFLKEGLKVDPGKISIHYPAVLVDEEVIPLPLKWHDKYVALSSGTAIPQKGTAEFIALARKAKAERKDFHFVWLGNKKKYGAELDAQLRSEGLDAMVEFIGESAHPHAYMRHAMFFISTSHEESFGLACAEAALLGKPVIGFAGTQGLEEVIKGCRGILAPANDLDRCWEELKQLSGDTVRQAEMQVAAVAYAEKFSGEAFFSSWERTLSSVMKEEVGK